jgi:hypothetical protein
MALSGDTWAYLFGFLSDFEILRKVRVLSTTHKKHVDADRVWILRFQMLECRTTVNFVRNYKTYVLHAKTWNTFIRDHETTVRHKAMTVTEIDAKGIQYNKGEKCGACGKFHNSDTQISEFPSFMPKGWIEKTRQKIAVDDEN